MLQNEYFTVDRTRSLHSGKIVTLLTVNGESGTIENAFVAGLFPQISHHGRSFLTQELKHGFREESGENMPMTERLPAIELIVELIRRSEFPNAPSRLQSMFGCLGIQSAMECRSRLPKAIDAPIYRVEPLSIAFHADMNLLSMGSNIAHTWYLARQYWAQSASERPFWEILFVPPVLICEQVA